MIRLDLLPQVDDMLFCELTNGHVSHAHSVLELFLGQLNFELVFIVFEVIFIVMSRLCTTELYVGRHVGVTAESKLIDEVRVVQEVVESEDATLPLLLRYLLIGDHVRRIHLGRDVHTVVRVSRAITDATNLTASSLGVQLEALTGLPALFKSSTVGQRLLIDRLDLLSTTMHTNLLSFHLLDANLTFGLK